MLGPVRTDAFRETSTPNSGPPLAVPLQRCPQIEALGLIDSPQVIRNNRFRRCV